MKLHLVLCLLLSAAMGYAQGSLPDSVARVIQQRIDNGYSPSIVVGLIDADGPQYYHFGQKMPGGDPVNEYSVYEIGSITKTFTAILLAQRVLAGEMAVDDPVQKYLPDSVTIPTRGGQEITLGHLSDHTSALPNAPGNMQSSDPANPFADYTVAQLYAYLNEYELPRDIGSAYEYSNLAQGLLGHVLALYAGQSYEAITVNHIAAPLGMSATKITLDEEMQANLALGHSNGRVVPNWDLPTLAGAGALRSNLEDMLRYIGANLGLIESPLYPAMQLTHQVRHDKAGVMRVGLGWHVAKGAEGDVIWHNGGTGGYRSFAGFVRETGKGVVVLTNATMGVNNIGFSLLDSGTKLNPIKPSVAIAIQRAIAVAENPDTAAWTTYRELKDAAEYDLDEAQLNALGYRYLENGNIPAALAVLAINVDAFPESANVYDSYGEALAKAGQREAAIENYRKSLDLHPGNDNAATQLSELGAELPPLDIAVADTTLASYVGTYQLLPTVKIAITYDGVRLHGQPTGQGRFALFATSPTEFYLKVVNAQITFRVSETGDVEGLILHQNGRDMWAIKVE